MQISYITVGLRISEIAFAAGFQSLSQFNRVFKRFSREIADAISVLPSVWFAGIGRIPIASAKKPEKMRSNYFLFLRILAIRVAFEANSMDPR